jgi:hypothetical protein
MRLLQATFLSVRGLADAAWSFGDPWTGEPRDVVVITGPPASGKTRFLEAILAAKEAIAPYGLRPKGGPWIADGAPAAKIELTFLLDEEEQRRVRSAERVVRAEAILTESGSRCHVDPEVATLLMVYAHDPEHGKIEYLPANRAVVVGGHMHGVSTAEQRLLRVTRDERKFSFIPRLLAAFTWDGRFAEARARFAGMLAELSPTARYLAPNQDHPLVCFSSRGSPPLHLAQLSATEAQAVLVAAAAALVRYERSIVLIDRPEVSAGERALVAWVEAVREVTGAAQLIVATDSPALVAAAPSRATVSVMSRRRPRRDAAGEGGRAPRR